MVELFQKIKKEGKVSIEQINISHAILSDLVLGEVLVCDEDKMVSLGDDFSLALYATECYRNSEVEVADYLFDLLLKKDDSSIFYVFLDYFIESDNLLKINLLLDRYFNSLKSEPDFNYKLYILNYIYDLDTKYKEYVTKLSIDDLLLEDNQEFEKMNDLRKEVYHNEYMFAYKSSSKVPASGVSSFSISTDYKLLYKASVRQKEFIKDVATLIKNDDLIKAKKLLEEKDSSLLSKQESKILYILEVYFDVLDRGVIPEKISEFDKNDLTESLYNNHFEDLIKVIYLKNGENASKNIIYVLLVKLIELIDSKKDNSRKETSVLEKKISFDLATIKEYLVAINKSEYLFLFENYLLLAKRTSGIKKRIKRDLDSIKNGNYKFDLDYYLTKFQEAISDNDNEKARIYLRIIYGAKAIGVNYPFISKLVEMFEDMGTNSVQDDKPNREIKKGLTDEILDVINTGRCVYLVPDLTLKATNKVYSELFNHRREVESFRIKYQGRNRIAVRKVSRDYVDFKEKFYIGKKAFEKNRIEEAFAIFKELIKSGNPNELVYYYYGMCLYILGQYDEALDTMIIANALANKSGYNRDFSKYIIKIEEAIGSGRENERNYTLIKK
ncbi:MAG: hypothetical protein IJI22_01640 [Bacilli bacterium]|nr:hypothetical protein [Bacilli bacterium]